ncbi:MAG: ParB/RepB/Spo0J family partition protein [Thermodesulfobacteriota bacterium]|nr:ParB/RepB/Spo0J family partition protein [Thermodesulfobacteriota bacterium]
MTRPDVLGRGLNALLPGSDEETSTGAPLPYFLCPLDSIRPNPFQPRKDTQDWDLGSLAESIREKGVLQPLIVRKFDDFGYELIAGERRLRAAKLAGLDDVPVIVKDVSDNDTLELALIENIQRQDLNPLEEAGAYKRLTDDFGLTQEEVADRVGKKRSTVTNSLRILQLPDYAKQDIIDGALTAGHARVLLGLPDAEALKNLRNEIISKGLSVRQTEKEAGAIKKGKGTPGRKRTPNQISGQTCRTITDNFSGYLGVKTKIVQNGKFGKLVIEYSSEDDLKRLMELIVKQ